jgi:hypothetical protein
MPTTLSPPDLANAVTSVCTIGAGVTASAFGTWVSRHPTRWRFAYFCIFLTGLPTLGWHGWGTIATDWTHETWRVADVGSNLLLAWAVQMAVAGDFYAPTFVRRLAIGSGALNLAAIGWMVGEGATGSKVHWIPLGRFGGFYAGEAVLITDAFLTVGLFYAARARIPAAARPLLYAVTALFLFGFGLAIADGDVVIGRMGSMHALWHVIGSFGLLFLWAFTEVRLRSGPDPGSGRR